MYGKRSASTSRTRYGVPSASSGARVRVFVRSFDAGEAVEVRRRGDAQASEADAVEYEVPRSRWGHARNRVGRPVEVIDVEAVRSEPSPLRQPVPPELPPVPPEPKPADPEPVKLASDPPSERPGRADSRPAISDDVLMSDIQSILSESKSPSRPAATRPPVGSQPPSRHGAAAGAGASGGEHEIFDRIAQSMEHAKTYDLGSVALQQRFDAFDLEEEKREEEKRRSRAATRVPVSSRIRRGGPERASSADFVEDLDRLGIGVSAGQADQGIPLDPGIGGHSIGADSLEPGDIILSTTDARISKVIQTVTDSPVSHSAIYIGDNRVVEAIGDGVILRSIDTALGDDSLAVAYRHRDMTPEKAEQVVRFLKQQARARREYDRWGLIRVAPGQLARAICNQLHGSARQACLDQAARLRVGTDDDDSFYCSELILEALKAAGLSISQVDPAWSSPGQILDLHLNGLLDYVGHLKV